MAPIKAVLRSKLGKADTAKSLMELVDRYELYSDVSCAASSLDDNASDSEVDVGALSPRFQQPQLQIERPDPQDDGEDCPAPLPTLFPRPPVAAAAAATAAAAEDEAASIALKPLQLQYLSQLFYQQMSQQMHARRHSAAQDDQPLNLSLNPLKRPASQCLPDTQSEADGDEEDVFGRPQLEAKRLCLQTAPPLTAVPVTAASSGQRRRKRSYRLSDNEEIRAFQASAPELFAWNGHKPMIHQFLLKLLHNSSCSGLIRWLDRDARLFKVLQPGAVARLWQFIKGNRTDNYECFARGIRHSRDIGKFFEAHELRKKKVYKFSEKALRPATAADRLGEEKQQHQSQHPSPQQLLPVIKPQPAADPLSGSGGRTSDVLAKLKLALAERLLQQQQLKEEPTDGESLLVIADCDHL